MWQAAIEFVSRTNSLTSTQSITTVANQSQYTLNADYLKLYLRNQDKNFYIKYNDGSADTFLLDRSKESIIFENSTASSQPSDFYIEDDPNLDSQISSTATAGGAIQGGQCTLDDATAPFADVSAGDIVHNTTDGSSGVVVRKASNSTVVTALFDGTNNDWTIGDSYVIQPQSRFRIVTNPPCDTTGHTMTVYYVQRPAPVYSDYGIYRIPAHHLNTLVFYAVWLYKYRDKEPNFGDKYYQFFENSLRQDGYQTNRALNRNKWGVNLRKRWGRQ